MRISLAALALTAVTCMASAVHTGAMEIPGSASVPPARGLSNRYAAVAFDYFVLFNPDSVVSVAERVVPGKGRALVDIWRNRQFEYSWLRSITQRYVDFSRLPRMRWFTRRRPRTSN